MRFLVPLLVSVAACASASGGGLDRSLSTLRGVGREGEGNEAAAAAWRAVVGEGVPALVPTLRAFYGASPVAANWLRSAVDAIAERGPLDPATLEAFVLETGGDGAARKLAYDWLVRVDPKAPDRLLPRFLEDPGQELRREAVARAVAEAKGAAEPLKAAFVHARDRDQVDQIAAALKKLGQTVDVQAHYGIIPKWTLLASFDNTEMKGFDAAYPPETKVDLKSELQGKGGKAVRVVECSTEDPHGKVDLNTTLGKEMGAVAYALATIESAEARPVEVRVATNNAVKIFLNGELVFFRNEYHHGMKMDQYVGKGRLKAGRNEVLLKVCQNEQKDDWAQTWSFQGRLCDALGTPVPVKVIR